MSNLQTDSASRRASGLRPWVRAHPVLAFFALAYALSWTAWLLAWMIDSRVLFLAGVFGPAAAGATVTRYLGGSLREWLRRMFHWRVAPRFYLFALGFPVVLYATMNAVLALLGQRPDLSLLPERIPGYLSTWAFVLVLGGGLEEPGWRGFALPRLQQRYTPVRATLLLGLVWGLWHLPVNGPAAFVIPLVLAFFYTWLYNRTQSVWLCILLHASVTPAQDYLVVVPDGLMVDLVMLGTLVAAAVALVVLTRGRLGLPPAGASPRSPRDAVPAGNEHDAARPPHAMPLADDERVLVSGSAEARDSLRLSSTP